MAGDKHSKTEEPTSKKIADARKEGQIARSQDIAPWFSMLVIAALLEWTVKNVSTFLGESIAQMTDIIENPDLGVAWGFALRTIKDGLLSVAPLMAGFLVLSIVGNLAQVRFVLALKAIKPSFKKINPINGVKRLMSPASLVQAGKELIKTIILTYIAYKTLYATVVGASQGGPYSVGELIEVTSLAALSFIKQSALAIFIVGIADYMYQKKKTNKDLRMTKQEVKEESRTQDLAPEVRSKIRQKQAQMSRNRMMAEISDADVAVVNPIHIAVVLKYNPEIGAPKVVAKGAGFVAESIREKAEEAGVPIVQDIPLARTLHRTCEINDEVPFQMFEAVAKLLAFVFSLKNRRSFQSGIHKMPGTPDLEDMPEYLPSGTKALAASP